MLRLEAAEELYVKIIRECGYLSLSKGEFLTYISDYDKRRNTMPPTESNKVMVEVQDKVLSILETLDVSSRMRVLKAVAALLDIDIHGR